MDDMYFGGDDLDLDMGGGDSGGGDLFGGDTGGGDMSGGDTGGDYGWDAGGGEDLNNAGGDYGWYAGGGEDLGGGLDDSASDTGSLDGLGEDTGVGDDLNGDSQGSLIDTGSNQEIESSEEVNDNLNGDGQGDEADNVTENVNNENVVEESDNLNVESQENLTDEKSVEDADSKEDFEIGGHQNMTLDEVEQYQQEGNELSEQMRDDYPPDAETNNTLTNEETIREEEIMEEREPGAELSHSEFFEEQDKFEAEVENQSEITEENTPEIEGDNTSDSEYVKIGGDTVNPESPYVTDRQTAEESGYIEKDGNDVIDSVKVQEELALPDENPAEYAHEMPHISEETHDLYVSDVAPTENDGVFSEHEGGGEQTIAIRQEGDVLSEGDNETPTYKPEHSPGDEGVIDDRKELDDFSNEDWESAYVENEMYDSVQEHNENYQDNQLDFYEISNSGEHFQRADGSSALEDYQENPEYNKQ